MDITDYHAKYYSYELIRRHPANNLEKLTAALQDAQVDLNPHQIGAALFAFRSPLSRGAILADEVGLGKTIEAGIILSQKWAEHKRRLLIIAPANLRKQWNQELYDKFFLYSVILETKSFNQEIKSGNLNPFVQSEIVICSYQFARTKDVYLQKVDWDLVIIDEAHRLRNVYKPSNKIANAIKNSLMHAQKVLLTATPLQNSLLELFGLVSVIDEYAFGDVKSFKSRYQRVSDDINFEELKTRLTPLCKRTLRRQVLEYINYTNRIAIVEEFYPYQEEIELYDLVTEYLRSPVLYALPAGQRNLMTLILRKLLASSTFAIQYTLEGLAAKLDELLSNQNSEGDTLIDEYEGLEEIRDEWNEEENEVREKEKRVLSYEELIAAKQERDSLKRFSDLAGIIKKNSKGDKLITALNKGFEKLKELGANQKAIIFTESTRTQEYLRGILESQGFNKQLVLFNGSNNDTRSKEIYSEWIERHKGTDTITGSRTADTRQAIVDYFRDSATIMIATEAAAEGINLQFCSLVVNYDLPWNPQRIEQRIGRCHRYGQKFDVVVINFINKSNEADQRVYQLLDEKFRLFDGVFGSSDEVLGSIESGVDFEKRIAQIYQECRHPAEIKAAFDLLQKELEPEIENKLDITRKKLFENFDEDVTRKLRINLDEGRQYLNQYEQWLWSITKYFLKDYARFDRSDNSFSLTTNPFPGEKIHSGPYLLLRTNSNRKKTEIEVADNTNIYRVGHPLAQKIIHSCLEKPLHIIEVTFDYSNTPKKITLLEPYIGCSGWLQAGLLTIKSFETEEYIVFSGITDDDIKLNSDICSKFFSLYGFEGKPVDISSDVVFNLTSILEKEKAVLIDDNMKRNSQYFDEEYDKLDKWADDMKVSLEREIKDIDAEIKLRKAEARKISELNAKIEEQRKIKDLEKKRNEKRKSLFEAQDQVDIKKDNLLSEIESRLHQTITLDTLFTIKWNLI
ncbi:MAG TPA: SNF2-related protein [Ignavibacteriaceae bacterium]|mgnify:CR=1 FL=1|nr:SNF2-related protein [Ignavibacteriaceae bacterium]